MDSSVQSLITNRFLKGTTFVKDVNDDLSMALKMKHKTTIKAEKCEKKIKQTTKAIRAIKTEIKATELK